MGGGFLENISSGTLVFITFHGVLRWLSGKEPACNAGDAGLILGSGRSPEGRGGNSLQYCHWENPMDRGAWQAVVHGVAKSRTQLKQLSTCTCRSIFQPCSVGPTPYDPMKMKILC